MVAQPSHATKEKKESGSLAATKIEYDIHHL